MLRARANQLILIKSSDYFNEDWKLSFRDLNALQMFLVHILEQFYTTEVCGNSTFAFFTKSFKHSKFLVHLP